METPLCRKKRLGIERLDNLPYVLFLTVRYIYVGVIPDKGKPLERVGRKATGLRSTQGE
jgi:hypothetical protein